MRDSKKRSETCSRFVTYSFSISCSHLVQKANTGKVTLEGLRADADTLVNAIARSSENSSSLPSSALAPLVVLRESVHVILNTTDANVTAAQGAGRMWWIRSRSNREELGGEIRVTVHEAAGDRVESVPCCNFCAKGNSASKNAFRINISVLLTPYGSRSRMTTAAVSIILKQGWSFVWRRQS